MKASSVCKILNDRFGMEIHPSTLVRKGRRGLVPCVVEKSPSGRRGDRVHFSLPKVLMWVRKQELAT